jgi:hypothetical protein
MKLISLILFLLFQLQVLSQPKKRLEFRLIINTQIPTIKDTFLLFYAIDSNCTFKKGKLTFYRITFSGDSLENSGFISINKKALLFIKDTLSFSKPQKIYSGANKSISRFKSFPYINGDVDIKQYLRQNSVVLKFIYLTPRNSHSSYIKEIEFKIGSPYPKSITIFFPFEEKQSTKLFPL